MVDRTISMKTSGLLDRATFDMLFRTYFPKVKSYVSSILSADEAEDITQDVFAYVWENRNSICLGSGFSSYLFQSAYTRSLDLLRKKNNFNQYSLAQMETFEKASSQLLHDDCREISRLYTQDFKMMLERLLAELPLQRREVFLLTYNEGLKSKEIADRMNIPQRTVESHMYLTMKFLKKHFPKDEFFLLFLLFIK